VATDGALERHDTEGEGITVWFPSFTTAVTICICPADVIGSATASEAVTAAGAPTGSLTPLPSPRSSLHATTINISEPINAIERMCPAERPWLETDCVEERRASARRIHDTDPGGRNGHDERRDGARRR
jgi:hypothetical protein